MTDGNAAIERLAYSADYIVGAGLEGIRVWGASDGKEMAAGMLKARHVQCLAVSRDGQFIAAGTLLGEVAVWDANTYKDVLWSEGDDDVTGVDFAPDSARLIVASNSRATIWDVATRKKALDLLFHKDWVVAAKFSLQGDLIATATPHCVRVYGSDSGDLLVHIPVVVSLWYNAGLLWSDRHLFIVSDGGIIKVEASTGSVVSELPLPDSNYISSLAILNDGEIVAYSVDSTVAFWDMSTQSKLTFIRHSQRVHSIALSPDSQFLAIGGAGGKVSLISGCGHLNLDIAVRQRLCESLYSSGRAMDSRECLLKMVDTFYGDIYTSKSITKWVSNLAYLCLSAIDCDTSYDKDLGLRTTTSSTTPTPLLRVWVKATLASGSWKDVLLAAVTIMIPKFIIYRDICEHLEATDEVMDASQCFRQMVDELPERDILDEEWVLNFRQRCSGKLEKLGDAAMSAEQHDDAVSHYSIALSLDPVTSKNLIIKRSQAYLASGWWENALNDANLVFTLEPLSPCGFEIKHAALHHAGDYKRAIDAFETMLSKMSHSTDRDIRERSYRYINPEQTKETIRVAIANFIRDSPLVLIHTESGHLLDKSAQAASFESQAVFLELISSTTTDIDHARIEYEVAQYYRYAMFSHKWEDNEPLFENVVQTTVYNLEESLAHDKLKMFCKIVRDAGIRWAWSDTCCINKADHFVLQEALVAMFKWYQGSTMTIILLRDVHFPSKRGDLMRSIWNTRAWTLQEYHASKVVRFYIEGWKPYMNLDIFNHKESPDIISEMEEATHLSAQALTALRPGLDDIREKLRLASTRQTTRIEDAAYSLLGIFNVSLPVVYGEGDKALGRLLAQLLTSSGDTSILAWSGRSGTFNSCLPSEITVFRQFPTLHIPQIIEDSEMDVITARLRNFSLNLATVTKLYDRLNELPVPLFVGQRMKLPCIIFKLGRVSASQSKSERVFRAQTAALGIVEIKTSEDLSRFDSLYLVHPWIDFLLDRHPVGSVAGTVPEGTGDHPASLSPFTVPSDISSATRPKRTSSWLVSRFGLPFNGRSRDATSLLPPSTLTPTEKQTRVLRFLARLRQPFGALLLTPTRQNVAEYKRVGAEDLITVRVEETTPAVLNKLVDSVRLLDVL